jgi:hypothetical protein
MIGDTGYQSILKGLPRFDSIQTIVGYARYEREIGRFTVGQQFVIINVPPSSRPETAFGCLLTSVTTYSIGPLLHRHETCDLLFGTLGACVFGDELTKVDVVVEFHLRGRSAQRAIARGL